MELIVNVENLSKLFPIKKDRLFGRGKKFIAAVDRVNLAIRKGETFGVVGESGSGKTTLARLILRLEEATSGRVIFKGQDIFALKRREIKKIRLNMQMIFQDPYSSLDPRHDIASIVAEPLVVHRLCPQKEMPARVARALNLVDLPDDERFMQKMPEELSGGQRQRVGIARVLVTGAEFIIGDEPVSMLDSNVKASIVALLRDLKQKIDLTYLFITHEIGLAYHICDRIAVMYGGRIVEVGPSEGIIQSPRHPYTRMLMDAIPPLIPNESWGDDIQAKGDHLTATDTMACSFVARCPDAADGCHHNEPQMEPVGPEHYVACHDRQPENAVGRMTA